MNALVPEGRDLMDPVVGEHQPLDQAGVDLLPGLRQGGFEPRISVCHLSSLSSVPHRRMTAAGDIPLLI